MGLTLREVLESLCSANGWCYAVFWKLKPRNRMILLWEDGHYQSTKPLGFSNISTLTTPDSRLKGWATGGKLLDYRDHSQGGSSMEDQIGLLVAKMSHQMHSLGEGIIGNTAFSGKHQWIFQENLLTERNSFGPHKVPSSFEYPNGWQNQFAAGIKTIAVIAVAPFGVVQLGSRQTIMEDLELVRRVKTLFGSVHNVSRPFLHDCVQELLSGKIHGAQPLTGKKSATLLHGMPNQSILKNPSSGVLEQGGDSTSILGRRSKGIQAEAHVLPSALSSLTKSLSHFSQLQTKGIQLSSSTSSHNNDQETLSRVSRTTLPNARVIYPLQGMLQASSCEPGNRQSLVIGSSTGNNTLALMEKQLAKEMGLQGQMPLLSTNGQTTVQTKFQNNTQSAFQEASSLNFNHGAVKSNNSDMTSQCDLNESTRDEGMLKSTVFESGPLHMSDLKQTEIHPSVPASRDVLRHREHLVSSSVPEMHTNRVEEMDRNPNPMLHSETIQAPVSAVTDPYYASWGMTSGQLETGLQAIATNDLIPSLGDDLLSAALGIGTQSWDKDITAKDVSSFFQDVMVDNLYSMKETPQVSAAAFGEVLPVTDECASHGFDDTKPLANVQESSEKLIPLTAPDELFDILGPAFKKTQDRAIWDDISLPLSDGNHENFISHSFGTCAGSQCPSEFDFSQTCDVSLERGHEGGFFPDRKSEHLLDAVVANIHPPVNNSAINNTSSKITFSELSSAPSLHSPSINANSSLTGTLSGSEQSKFVDVSQWRDNTANKTIKNSFTPGFQCETFTKSSPNDASFKSQLSSWIEDSKSAKCENMGLAQAKKSDEPVKVNRKRARPGESTRPRPKDRQQIQDRVKELREIVPNGIKCSIDALLERTIKHMLFLQSVTKHADKLKQSGEPKVLDKDVLLRKENLEGGASWALEVGGQSMACPIIVEDMGQPRQMLVEMVCDEQGLFLEIAEIIRGLGLTILKGVMEARNDKIWARFAVEANRDVHRLEILWSLMQLLPQNTKNIMSPSSIVTHQGIDSGSQPLNSFQQASVPSTLSIAERLQ